MICHKQYIIIIITRPNVIAIKSDFTNLKNLNVKFDIVICRGVLQHTPNPYTSIINLYELCSPRGIIYFDVYKKPKLKIINQNIYGDIF